MLPIIINDVPVMCINQSALHYHVPAILILAIMQQEKGKNGDAIRNKNGTFDYGVMQINSVWLSAIERYGYTKEDLQYNPCKNVEVATWILSQHLAGNKPLWQSIANYHSNTLKFNKPYQGKIFNYYAKLASAINS